MRGRVAPVRIFVTQMNYEPKDQKDILITDADGNEIMVMDELTFRRPLEVAYFFVIKWLMSNGN